MVPRTAKVLPKWGWEREPSSSSRWIMPVLIWDVNFRVEDSAAKFARQTWYNQLSRISKTTPRCIWCCCSDDSGVFQAILRSPNVIKCTRSTSKWFYSTCLIFYHIIYWVKLFQSIHSQTSQAPARVKQEHGNAMNSASLSGNVYTKCDVNMYSNNYNPFHSVL